jgi:glycine/D-amino acid oxidase-like deaminating enzyme
MTEPALRSTQHFGAAIVGGGPNGLAAAYYLADDGKRVIVARRSTALLRTSRGFCMLLSSDRARPLGTYWLLARGAYPARAATFTHR